MPPLDVARRAARVGGEILSQYFRNGVSATSKDPLASYNLVSEADIKSEQAVVAVIREAFPEHAVMAEESQPDRIQAEHLWVIDPLDGTTNFVHGIAHFAISIAYYHAGQPICGVVFNPARGDWYEAVRDQGAQHNGQTVRVSSESRLDEALIGVGFYYDRGAMMEATLAAVGDLFRQDIRGIRRFGTAALDLAEVARGGFGAFFELQLSPWDFAAGRLFVEESGGRVTDCAGRPLPLAKSSVLASNGLLHDALLGVVRPHAANPDSANPDSVNPDSVNPDSVDPDSADPGSAGPE